MNTPDKLSDLNISERLQYAGAILAATAVGILAGTDHAEAQNQIPSQAERPHHGIGTAVQGFVDPKTGRTGALYSRFRAR